MSTEFAALAAPLERGELEALSNMMYRALNRLCDEAERALHTADTSRPLSAEYAAAMTDSARFAGAMREAAVLHAETAAEISRRAAATGREVLHG